MTVSDAVTIFADVSDIEESYEWEDFLTNVRWVGTGRWPSFYEVDEWDGREERRILQNDLARIVVCEYCGLASINLAARTSLGEYSPDLTPLAKRWVAQIAGNFCKWMQEHFTCYAKQGTMSNGVSVYEKL
jgi:hypothetical protein